MERAHFAVVAIVVAVFALLGMRVFSPSEPAPHDHFGSDVAPGMAGADGTRVRRLPMEGQDRVGPEGGRKAPGQPSDGPGTKRRGGAGGGAGALGSAEVIAGSARARSVIGSGSGSGRGTRRGDGAGDDDLLLGALGTRLPGAPQPRGGRDLNLPDSDPSRQTIDFVDEDPENRPTGADAPLMSIPFKGAVDAETGDIPLEATGLVAKDDGVQFPDDARLSFPSGGRVDGEAGSISFEIEPTWAGSDITDQSMVQIRNEHVWENTLQIVKNINTLRFIIIDEGGIERNVNVFIDDWQPGEAHEVTATWGEAQMSLYIDGNLVGQNTVPNNLSFPPTTPIHIGSDFAGTSYRGAGATIRDFQLYGRALSTDEVTRQ